MNIAIIHTRIRCPDGVSKEIDKWSYRYRSLGHKIFFISGKICRKPKSNFLEIPEADYLNLKILALQKKIFNKKLSKREVLEVKKMIYHFVNLIKPKMKKYLVKNNIDFLHVENLFSLPINLPLSISVKEIMQELKIPSVIRHHDFYWGRKEYQKYSYFKNLLKNTLFPNFKNTVHIVINKGAKKDLKKKTGINPIVIYNKFDIKNTQKLNHYNIDLRRNLGVKKNQLIFLQPTRITERKKIERSIILISKFNKKSKKEGVLVITGPYNNKSVYHNKLKNLGKRLKVKIMFAYKKINHVRHKIDNKKIYSIGDIYSICDVVTFPSDIEGFGNPAIESVIYKKPLFTNKYPVMKEFLKLGFDFVTINGKVTDKAVYKLYKILTNKKIKKKILAKNIKISNKYFSSKSTKNDIRKIIKMTK